MPPAPYPGVLSDDPIAPLLSDWAECNAQLRSAIHELTNALQDASIVVPDTAARLEQAAAAGADRHAAALAQAHSLRTALVYCAITAGIATATGLGGYVIGTAMSSSDMHQTDQRIAEALHDRPSSAARWADLIQFNDITQSLSLCTGPRLYADASGRRACTVPLYIEPARRSAPVATAR
jgi:hypothetical protein